MTPKRILAGAILVVTGLGVAAPNVVLFEGGSLAGIVASALGVVLGLAVLVTGILLYRSSVSTAHALRVSGWNVLGVVVLGLVLLLATWYPGVSLPIPIAASILGVSAVAHILIGVTDVRRIRVGELAREREKLAVLNRLARHNLRNQAQVLTSAGELVGESVDDETGVEAADRVVQGANRIATINEKLKRFQEATERQGQVETRPVEMVVTEVVEEYRTQYPDADIDLEMPAEGTATVPVSVRTALDELLENAFQHGDAVTSGVTVRVRHENGAVDLTVADDGPGIPRQEWDVVSGEIEQSQLRHASGLGLWVVKATVESVDGSFELDEGGTAVTLSVPTR